MPAKSGESATPTVDRANIERLTATDQLRLAADCLDRGDYRVAYEILNGVAHQLRAVALIRGDIFDA